MKGHLEIRRSVSVKSKISLYSKIYFVLRTESYIELNVHGIPLQLQQTFPGYLALAGKNK